MISEKAVLKVAGRARPRRVRRVVSDSSIRGGMLVWPLVSLVLGREKEVEVGDGLLSVCDGGGALSSRKGLKRCFGGGSPHES